MATLLLQLIGGVVLMFIRTKHSPRRHGVVFPLIFTAALITYIIGYITGIPAFAESDITLVICTFALLFLELCIQSGQMPVNIHYRRLFRKTGLNMQITDASGVCVFASDGAEPFGARQWEQIKDSDDHVQVDETTLLRKREISGGYAVWREDISAISKLKEEIAARSREIEAATTILSNEAQEKERGAYVKTRIELHTAFEKDIAAYERQLDEMLGAIPAGETERAAYMGAVAVLVCYIKRRCNFLVMEMGGAETVPFNEYVVYIDELAELARLAGIQCLAFCNLAEEIKLRQVMLFYDLLYLVTEWTIKSVADAIVAQTVAEGGRFIMKLTASAEAMDFELPKRTASEIRDAGGTFEKKDLGDDRTGLILSFPERGGRDA